MLNHPQGIQPMPFDPPGGVLTTDRLDAYMDEGKPMLNNYTRYAKIGDGQHGEVYLCYRTDTKYPPGHPGRRTMVAMKSVKRNNLRAEQMKRLRKQRYPNSPHVPLVDNLNTTEAKIRKEIAIMKKCRHPHVVRLFEVIDDRMKDKIYMVIEYLGGGEVKWRNEHELPVLTLSQTRRILRDAVLGLEYLHHQGIIHRDIKPANLLWTEDRRQVKIADFGVSHFSYAQRLASAGSEGIEQDDPYDPILLDDSDLTRRAGTPSFLAPEIIFEHTHDVPLSTSFSSQVHAQSSSASVHTVQPQEKITKPPITKAIDIWALGVTLYCLLFGKTPFVADPGAGITEWSLYNSICNSDWTVADTMGSDQAPTGGRQPKEDDESAAIIHLLDHLLQKDVKARITLDEVKHHPWVLEGLQDPQRWLRITSPVKKIHVSLHETSEAMSTVHFRWNWGALSRRISSILRTVRPRPTRIRDHEHSHNRGAISEPHVAETSTTQHSETRLLMQEPPKRDKGKKKAGEKLNTQSLRSKSIERWPINPHHTQRSSSVIIQGSGRKPRRGSETILDERQEPPASPSHSTDRRARWSLLLSLIVGRRTGKNSAGPSPTETDPIQIRSSPRLPGAALSQGSAANRRSEEALRYYRSGQSMSGRLTAARRASSWGQGDKPNEVAEVVSVVSVGSVERKMNEHSMIVGAGGLHNDTHLHVPRTASSLASSPLREITHPSPLSDEEEEAERLFGLRSYDDSSTVASGRDNYGDPVEHSSEEGEWKTGSDLEDEEDDDDDDDADKEYDSDDQDNVVTFSPRRRTPHQ